MPRLMRQSRDMPRPTRPTPMRSVHSPHSHIRPVSAGLAGARRRVLYNPVYRSRSRARRGTVRAIAGSALSPLLLKIDCGVSTITSSFSEPEAREFFDETEIEKRLSAIEKRGSTLIGDVHPKEALAKAGKLTPVPGGVGLLTVAMLMRNTIDAARERRKR